MATEHGSLVEQAPTLFALFVEFVLLVFMLLLVFNNIQACIVGIVIMQLVIVIVAWKRN